MKVALVWLLAFLCLNAEESAKHLLPLEKFFADPSRSCERISPSGKWISYLEPDDQGLNQLWVVAIGNTDQPICISRGVKSHVNVSFWVSKDRMVWQSQNQHGNTEFFVATPGAEGIQEIKLDQQLAAKLAGIAGLDDSPALILSIADKSTAYPDLYRLALDVDAKPVKIFTNQQRVFMWSLDGSGKPIAGLRWTDGGEKEIVCLRDPTDRVIFRAEAGDDLRLLSVSSDGETAWIVTNQGSDLTRLIRIDLKTGDPRQLTTDPLGKVDIENIILDPMTLNPMAASYSGEAMRWQSLDPTFNELLDSLQRSKPGFELVSANSSHDKKSWLMSLQRKSGLAECWIYHTQSKRLQHLWNEYPELDEAELCETKTISYRAKDGTSIPAYLTLPKNSAAPVPLVVFPHGGPNMRTSPGFDGRVQFLASRGYAVLQPNFRGSRGYGKNFMNAGDGQWGLGVMQSDLTDGVGEMINRRVAKKGSIAILGGSYGGYAAMAGLCFTPDVYAAGISLFGISDLNTYVSQVPPEWEPYKGDLMRRLGDPSTPTGRADLTARSPLYHTSPISAPLLIYHGLKDPLISFNQSSTMVSALKQSGKSVSFLVAENEGHGFSEQESEMAVYRAMEVFLHEHIGGKLSNEPSAEVNSCLNEMRLLGDRHTSPNNSPRDVPGEKIDSEK